MPKYRLYGKVEVEVSIVVKAEDVDAAYEAASDLWPGLSGYVGNGGTGDRMIGPADYEHDEKIEDMGGGDDPEWNHVEEVEGDE
jgi:hypothetical protein